MAILGVFYGISGRAVEAPDEEVWEPISIGDSLNGEQKRSPYRYLTWRKRVSGRCRLKWHDYDNTRLTSLHTRPPGSTTTTETYTDAFCLSVTSSVAHNAESEITARFRVKVS